MSNRIGVLGLGAAAILASVTFASAADLGGPTPPAYAPYTPEFSWAGFYAGINGGGGWGSEDCVSCSPGANDFGIGGPELGIQAGYNWEFAQVVFGVEADFQWAAISGLCNGTIACNGPPQLTVQSVDYYGTVRGRLGWAMDGGWLPYLSGGWAYGQGTRTSSVAGATSTWHSGWVAGAGIEYAIMPGWSANFEYQYVNLGSAQYILPGPGPDPTVGLSFNVLRLGLNRHF